MKRSLIFLTVIFTIISCSKNSNSLFNENSTMLELNSTTQLTNLNLKDTTSYSKYLNYKPLTAHEKDSINRISSQKISSTVNAAYGILTLQGPEYTDYSGLIHFQVFSAISTKTNHPLITVSVTSNYAMVGGGALVYGYSGNGAFLTESRPLSSTTWQAQSKDHIIADPHYLKVFAIGMRIDNVDPAYLRSKIHIVSNTSAYSENPGTSVSVPANCILVGGGAFDNYVNGYGNMLKFSFPIANEWNAGGQSYRRSDPCQITAYAIGIEDISYPTVGYLQTTLNQTTVGCLNGLQYCYAPVNSGFALTCPGGYSSNHLTGRMLVGLYPQDAFPGSQAMSNDTPGFGDYGSLSSYALGLQKRPY
jgi:hypothetical protein